MNKFFLAIILALAAYSIHAQIVTNSKFKPIPFQQMAGTLMAAKQFQEECLSSLEAMANKTESIEFMINKDKDPVSWGIYSKCYNAIIDEYNGICKRGTNVKTRNNLSKLRTTCNELCAKIKNAYERRNNLSRDQYARLQSVQGLRCDKFYSDISLDEFLDGKSPTIKYYTLEQQATQK